jgi:hypothetical protein
MTPIVRTNIHSSVSFQVKLGPYNLTVGVEIVDGFTVVFRFHGDEHPPPPEAERSLRSIAIRADIRIFNICD